MTFLQEEKVISLLIMSEKGRQTHDGIFAQRDLEYSFPKKTRAVTEAGVRGAGPGALTNSPGFDYKPLSSPAL